MAEQLNFDGMTDEDLLDAAKALDKEIVILTAQRRYITESSIARELRKGGDINGALRHERNADLIHKSLPDEIRW
jgi:hypothetical protein